MRVSCVTTEPPPSVVWTLSVHVEVIIQASAAWRLVSHSNLKYDRAWWKGVISSSIFRRSTRFYLDQCVWRSGNEVGRSARTVIASCTPRPVRLRLDYPELHQFQTYVLTNLFSWVKHPIYNVTNFGEIQLKIHQSRPGLYPRTLDPETSTILLLFE